MLPKMLNFLLIRIFSKIFHMFCCLPFGIAGILFAAQANSKAKQGDIHGATAAASKAKVPIDKSKVITMHVTTSIEEKKLELQKALVDGYNVILIPRPWPKDPEKHFMPSEIAKYLKQNGFDTSKMKVHVFESLTTVDETSFEGTVEELEGKEFSDLSVMVFNQATLESYINFE